MWFMDDQVNILVGFQPKFRIRLRKANVELQSIELFIFFCSIYRSDDPLFHAQDMRFIEIYITFIIH